MPEGSPKHEARGMKASAENKNEYHKLVSNRMYKGGWPQESFRTIRRSHGFGKTTERKVKARKYVESRFKE